MSDTLAKVRRLVAEGSVRISNHGYDELAADGLFAGEVLTGVDNGLLVEDYPQYGKGPCALILQADSNGRAVHAVWGIPKGRNGPAVLITAYRPNPDLWENGFLRRRP